MAETALTWIDGFDGEKVPPFGGFSFVHMAEFSWPF